MHQPAARKPLSQRPLPEVLPRFSLRLLLVIVTCCCIAFALLAKNQFVGTAMLTFVAGFGLVAIGDYRANRCLIRVGWFIAAAGVVLLEGFARTGKLR